MIDFQCLLICFFQIDRLKLSFDGFIIYLLLSKIIEFTLKINKHIDFQPQKSSISIVCSALSRPKKYNFYGGNDYGNDKVRQQYRMTAANNPKRSAQKARVQVLN